MLDREQLETFACVAEQQSFDRAATLLAVSRGAVSLRIRALEERLGTTLLIRDKPVVPTPPGENLLRHVQALRLMEHDVLHLIAPERRDGARVPMAIAVNADSLATWFAEPLWQLLQHPGLALEVIADDQDHTAPRLARGEVIGCISTVARPASGFRAEAIGGMDYRCYASPAFAARHFADGLTVPSALQAPAVLFDRKDALHTEFLQRLFGLQVDKYPRHYLPAPVTLMQGIVEGVGYGLVPEVQALPVVEAGGLIDLAPQFPTRVQLYWHHWDHEPALAASLTDHIVREARKRLLPVTDDPAACT